jgi:hypothetical protein
MDNGNRKTIIVDFGSIGRRLMLWRDHGELRQAQQIAESIPENLDGLLTLLGTKLGRASSRLKDYNDRRLLLPSEPIEGPLRLDEVARAFERAGFRRAAGTSSDPGVPVLLELLRDLVEERRPKELIVATADPGVVDVIALLRPADITTGVICILNKSDTERMMEIPDGLIDLRDVSEVLGIEMQRGFQVGSDDPAFVVLSQILRNAESAGWMSLEGLLSELENQLRGSSRRATGAEVSDGDREVVVEDEFATLPTSPIGRRVFVEELVERLPNNEWIWAPTSSGLVSRSSLVDVAEQAERIGSEGWSSETVGQLLHFVQQRTAAGAGNAWLGYGSFKELVRGAREVIGGLWQLPDEDLLDDAPGLEQTEDAGPDDKLRRFARAIQRRLSESDHAVPLVDLANSAPTAAGVSSENGWEGRGSFLELVRELNGRFAGGSWILDTDVAPGFIRLSRHTRPVTPTAGERSSAQDGGAVTALRRVVANFPNDNEMDIMLRAAVLATVLTRTATVRLGTSASMAFVTAGARDLSERTVRLSGRSDYSFLFKSAVSTGGASLDPRDLFTRTADVTARVYGEHPWKAGQPSAELMGTRELLRIVSMNFQQYLRDQGFTGQFLEHAQQRLGPADPRIAANRMADLFAPEALDDIYRRYSARRPRPDNNGSGLLEGLLYSAQQERHLVLKHSSPAGARDRSTLELALDGDIEEAIEDRLADLGRDTGGDGVRFTDLQEALAQEGFEVGPLRLGRHLAERSWSGDTAEWRLDDQLPYSRILPANGAEHAAGTSELQWYEYSMAFWEFLMVQKPPRPVSWVEATQAVIRQTAT